VTLFPEDGLKNDLLEAAATLEGHQKKVSLVHFHPVANNILASSSYDLTIKIWDIQKAANVCTQEFAEVVQSFEWNYRGSQMLATCKDKTVKIFDPRKKGAVQSTTGLAGTKPARGAWMDNHNALVVLGFSVTSTRQYAIYDPRKFTDPIKVEDIDQSAGVLIPFYDPDNSVLYFGGKGDASIKYFESVDEDPFMHYLSEYRTNESQKGLCFVPKLALETKDCEIALALRLMKDHIQPVSFQVPRKSDIFQADLYPDTYAGIPGLSEDEWLSGKDKDPPMASMKDKESKHAGSPAASSGPKFVAVKSAGELQKELDAANQRIKELEALVAKLQAK